MGAKQRKKKQRREQEKVDAVSKHRAQHADKYLWDAMPLSKYDKSLDRSVYLLNEKELDPYEPVRTRDGRPAFLKEIDDTKTGAMAGHCITALIPNVGDVANAGEWITIKCDKTGSFRNDRTPSPQDLFNLPPKKWNKQYEAGRVPCKAIDWETVV